MVWRHILLTLVVAAAAIYFIIDEVNGRNLIGGIVLIGCLIEAPWLRRFIRFLLRKPHPQLEDKDFD